MQGNRWIYAILSLLFLLTGATVFGVFLLTASLPDDGGEVEMGGLTKPVVAGFDTLGVPQITAESRLDAMQVLGFVHARDRLFQMDLVRRRGAGRLAEIFGQPAVEHDKHQRALRLEAAAQAVWKGLAPEQKHLLEAYAAGVNSFLARGKTLPFEFILLGYHPEPWRPEDSVIVVLNMFQLLTLNDADERMLTVMQAKLPPAVSAFLTPDTDIYATPLLGGAESRRPAQPLPIQAIARLLTEAGPTNQAMSFVDLEGPDLGSNNWAVSGAKTHDGRAIVANDMHLPPNVPNIWYRATLRYGGVELAGVTLPGVPALVAGSNGHVAWGFTNVTGDFTDLVVLELRPGDDDFYRTPTGWREFEVASDVIRIRDGRDVTVQTRTTVWGPVLDAPLLERPVALRWLPHDVEAVNFDLVELDKARSLEQAMAIFNRAGLPPQNVILADEKGQIAWTLMGKYPQRVGFDGATAVSWAQPGVGWNGYIPPEALPRIVNPREGWLATANNRTLGKNYPHLIGINFAHSYRAHRIAEWLREHDRLTERDLFRLQLDTVTEFYAFYRQLALDALSPKATYARPELAKLAAELRAWNGRADRSSRGLGLLIVFRQKLSEALFTPLLQRCKQAAPDFNYQWREMDTPLRTWLTERSPLTLPHAFDTWDALLIDSLERAADELRERHKGARLSELPWGAVNRFAIAHPLSRALPFLGRWLNMPEVPLAGCASFCVRVVSERDIASERMVVSPNHPLDGILQMPGGQSGHPLSTHYADFQAAWVEGSALGFASGPAAEHMRFRPAD